MLKAARQLAAACPRVLRCPRGPRGLHLGHQRGFAASLFKVPSSDGAPELSLFVVGLNEGKFFGQDGAEEGLKLIEQVANNHPEYHLLFGIPERDLARLEEENKIEKGKLTPSRELEGSPFCEMIPLLQAGMMDKRPRRAVGRPLKTTQAHVAWQFWKHPRECFNMYWAYWRRRKFKDIARYKFGSTNFPMASYAFFNGRAHIISIRATEHLGSLRAQGLGSSSVLVVNNDIYHIVIERLNLLLDEDAAEKLQSPDFAKNIREAAMELCAEIPDLTVPIILLYAMVPLLLLQSCYLVTEYYVMQSGVVDAILDDSEARE